MPYIVVFPRWPPWPWKFHIEIGFCKWNWYCEPCSLNTALEMNPSYNIKSMAYRLPHLLSDHVGRDLTWVEAILKFLLPCWTCGPGKAAPAQYILWNPEYSVQNMLQKHYLNAHWSRSKFAASSWSSVCFNNNPGAYFWPINILQHY